jgi:predicted transcriptional regulator
MSTITIEIKPLKESLKEFAEAFSNKEKRNKISIAYNDIDRFRKFFSPKRLALLHLIKQEKPTSIYRLAKLAKREYKNVHQDVAILQRVGVLTKELRINTMKIELCV